MNRREALCTLATGGATGALAAGAIVATVSTEATSADPFLAFADKWQTADEHFDNLAWPMSDEEANASFVAILRPFPEQCQHGNLPPATTAAGAAAALRRMAEYCTASHDPIAAPLLAVVQAYLEGRA